MLVLSRYVDQRIIITDDRGNKLTLMVTDISNQKHPLGHATRGKVRLGFDAPENFRIMREELIINHEANQPLETDVPDAPHPPSNL